MTPDEYDITQPYLGLIQKYRPKPDEADQEAQKRIAKGNALAEAFRIMIDAVGASKGANVIQRDINNPVMKAVDNYYKLKEQDKAEQSQWDKMELGAGLDALKTKSSQDFSEKQRLSQQEFSSGQQKAGQEFQAGEAEKNRALTREEKEAQRSQEDVKLKQNADQFRQNLALQTKAQADKTAVDYAQIAQQRERWNRSRPYGTEKGIFISDPDLGKQIHIPDDKRAQILAFIEKDPAVSNEIPMIKMRFGNLPPEQTAEFILADYYSALSPQTRAAIRQFVGEDQPPATPQGPPPGAQSLLNNPMAPSGQPDVYNPNLGPVRSQQPTIKTDKGSTMVRTEPSAAQIGTNTLAPEDAAAMQKIVSAKALTPEQKRSAVYKYLVGQDFDPASAKSAAEMVYQSLTGK